MKQRKFLSGLLALALAMGLCVPVSAAGEQELATGATGTTITITSTLQLPKIKVTIAGTPAIAVNPYKMSFTPTGASGPITDTLFSAPTTIKSNSTIKMNVSATPTASSDGNVTISATEDTVATATTPTVFMKLAMKTVNASGDVATFAGTESGVETAVVKKSDSGSKETATITFDAAATEQESDAKYAAVRFLGSSGGQGWTANDTVTVSVVFNIDPVIS